MIKLNMIDKLFVSITFAEERMFKSVDWRDLLRKWNDVWVNVAFAEGGIYDGEAKNKYIPIKYCELGDTCCFMTRNA